MNETEKQVMEALKQFPVLKVSTDKDFSETSIVFDDFILTTSDYKEFLNAVMKATNNSFIVGVGRDIPEKLLNVDLITTIEDLESYKSILCDRK